MDHSGEFLVIGSRNSLVGWDRCLISEECAAIRKKVDDLLGEPNRYRVYELLVGGIMPRFQATER